MASEQDDRRYELEKRRQERQARADQRRKQQKARKELLLRLGGAAVAAVLAAGVILWFTQNHAPQAPILPEQITDGMQVSTAELSEQPEETEPTKTESTKPGPTTVIHIAAAGDLNITDQMLKNAKTADGYDFTRTFLDVAPVLAGADLTLMNFEGTLSGEPYGAPTSSAPQQLAQQLATIGVDVMQTANSASIRAGLLGLQSTIDGFYNAGILPVGTFASKETFRKTGGYSIMEVQGIRIAIVGFTKGMDNLGLPEGSEDCVNLLYEDYTTDYQKVDTDGINRVLERVAEEKPDLTIAMVHWGSENNEEISASQQKIRRLMLAGGVDVILGTHPHLVQTIDYDGAAGTLVAYSLGDFYGDAPKAGTEYSLILDIEVTRDNGTGVTKVTGYDYTPIYTLLPDQSAEGGQRVVQLQQEIIRYEGNYVGKVTDGVYEDMKYALQRLEERTTKEVE